MAANLYTKAVAAGAVLALCLGAAACHPKKLGDAIGDGAHVSTSDDTKTPITVVDRLDCPQNEGALTLVAAATDGRSCAYRMAQGMVELSLASGADDAAALAPFKAQVNAAMPRQANGASATVSVSSEKSPDGRDVDKVDMPFIHIRDDGRRSHVSVLGISIDAADHEGRRRHDSDDDDDSALIQGNVTGGAARGRESVYILAGDPATSQGYHAVGYIARGDGQGRAVVALFKSRNGNQDNHDHDLDALLDLNARKG